MGVCGLVMLDLATVGVECLQHAGFRIRVRQPLSARTASGIDFDSKPSVHEFRD